MKKQKVLQLNGNSIKSPDTAKLQAQIVLQINSSNFHGSSHSHQIKILAHSKKENTLQLIL